MKKTLFTVLLLVETCLFAFAQCPTTLTTGDGGVSYTADISGTGLSCSDFVTNNTITIGGQNYTITDCSSLPFPPSSTTVSLTAAGAAATLPATADFSGGGGSGSSSCAYAGDGTLPVELLSFKGETTDNGNLLTWQTASEENNAGFEVQKSINGLDFQTIGFVEGNGTTLEMQSYEFLDENTTKTINYYRLKQVDFDGVFDYSPIIQITREQSNNPTIKIYPNPIQDILTIENGQGQAILYNTLGQPIRQFEVTNDHFEINLSDLPKGLYNLQIVNKNGNMTVKQLIR